MPLSETLAIGEPRAVVNCFNCGDLVQTLFLQYGLDEKIKTAARETGKWHYTQQPDHKILVTLFNKSWPLK